MQELDDIALLRQYTEQNSEEAFAALVSRHVNKVYSVALRHTRNPHQAEEITQAVFVILANKSLHLGKGVVLSGWLYQTARLTAVTFIRSEIRGARREPEAHMQNLLNETESDVWPQIAPLLDATMAAAPKRSKLQIISRQRPTSYVPLRCHSYYSFLDSTLSPTAIVQLAKRHELPAVALTDTGNLHGVVEFVQAAQATGIKPIIGSEVRVGSHPTLLYAANATGYFNLCRLLSRHAEGAENEPSVAAKQRAEIERSCLAEHNDGLIAVSSDSTLAEFFAGRLYRAATQREGQIACPAVHYGKPEDRQRYDILQSIRTLTLLEHEHPDKRRDGRFHFRTRVEFGGMCAQNPEWIRATHEIADRCDFAFRKEQPVTLPPFLPLKLPKVGENFTSDDKSSPEVPR